MTSSPRRATRRTTAAITTAHTSLSWRKIHSERRGGVVSAWYVSIRHWPFSLEIIHFWSSPRRGAGARRVAHMRICAVNPRIGRRSGRRMFILRCSVFPQLFGAIPMPSVYLWIALCRKGISRQIDWKRLPVIRIYQSPVTHSELYKRRMFLRLKKNLNCLPPYKPS